MLLTMTRFLFFLTLLVMSNSLAQQVGDIAPNFTLVNQSGEVVILNNLIGKPLVINIWATWCPPCREELPLFELVNQEINQKSYKATSNFNASLTSTNTTSKVISPQLNIVLINNSEKASKALAYLAENNISLISGVDSTKEQKQQWKAQGVNLENTLDVIRRYRVRGMPTTFYIDSRGVIQVVKIGLVSEASMIKDLLSIGIRWIPESTGE